MLYDIQFWRVTEFISTVLKYLLCTEVKLLSTLLKCFNFMLLLLHYSPKGNHVLFSLIEMDSRVTLQIFHTKHTMSIENI